MSTTIVENQLTTDEFAHDFSKLNEIILPLIRRSDEYNRNQWQILDKMMISSFSQLARELQFNRVKAQVLQAYWKTVKFILTIEAKKGNGLDGMERKINKLNSLLFRNPDIKLPYLRKRGKRAFNLIKNDLVGCRFLDLGCGDGMLLNRIYMNRAKNSSYSKIDFCDLMIPKYLGMDVKNYVANENKHLPFIRYSEGTQIPLNDKIFDTTILWTVLHHSTDPEYLLEETIRVTKKRIILVEGYIKNTRTYILNCFLDWFFNRPGKGVQINLPLEYKTVKQWTGLIRKLGWKIVRSNHIGIDEKVVPEDHIIFIIEPDH